VAGQDDFSKSWNEILHMAASADTNVFENLADVLRSSPGLLRERDVKGRTILYSVAEIKEPNFNVVQSLLNYGADLEAVDIFGQTPIMHAVNEKSLYFCALLLLNRVDAIMMKDILEKVWQARTTTEKKAVVARIRRHRKVAVPSSVVIPAERKLDLDMDDWRAQIPSEYLGSNPYRFSPFRRTKVPKDVGPGWDEENNEDS
jgi:ankyrin repeat protein